MYVYKPQRLHVRVQWTEDISCLLDDIGISECYVYDAM